MKRLVSNPVLDRLSTVLGLRRRARQACREAAGRGERLRFGWNGVYWKSGDKEVVFPFMDPEAVNYHLARRDAFLPRLRFVARGQTQVADLRRPTEYRLPSGGTVLLPVPAEPIDFFTGYFAKGAPQPGQIVFDAGAYCGETTLEMAVQVGPEGHVFAFEPDPKNLVWLQRNVERSGLKNVTVVPKGLWSKTTTLEFFSDENPASALVDSASSGAPHESLLRIDVLSPSDAFALAGRPPDFIKMDIEGAEVEVVEAMTSLPLSAKIRLAIASYHLRNGAKTCDLITPLLAGAGLTVETGYPPHLTTWAWSA